jgi:hypothetical protein
MGVTTSTYPCPCCGPGHSCCGDCGIGQCDCCFSDDSTGTFEFSLTFPTGCAPTPDGFEIPPCCPVQGTTFSGTLTYGGKVCPPPNDNIACAEGVCAWSDCYNVDGEENCGPGESFAICVNVGYICRNNVDGTWTPVWFGQMSGIGGNCGSNDATYVEGGCGGFSWSGYVSCCGCWTGEGSGETRAFLSVSFTVNSNNCTCDEGAETCHYHQP